MAGTSSGSSMPKKATTRQLHMKADLILKSKKNANVLCEVLEMFNRDEKNYTPLLLTVEMIFCTMLRRGDMNDVVSNPSDSPEVIHARWLRSNYELATARALACLRRGEDTSRAQALVTCCKMMAEEGRYLRGVVGFPEKRLKEIFDVLLDRENSQTAAIERFQEYTEYRDVQQCGLQLLSDLAYNKSPTETYMQNYLELFDVLMKPGLCDTPRSKTERHPDDKYLVERDGAVSLLFSPDDCKLHINRCWSFCVKWPLRATERNHRRALVVLVDRVMPHLYKPVLTTDLLCDSLDCGSSISMIALRGMLVLVTRHKVDFPDIYDRLYGMFEPEMFATRSKKRLLHLADIFLSSTRLSETLVAAFAKRFARLALVACPEDAGELLKLLSNLLQRHPGLKRMLRHDQPAIMPKDPYVMEETCTNASRAVQSSLWEVSALQQHYAPEVSAAATKVLAFAEDGARPPDLPPALSDQEQFDMEVKKRFKTIEMNFIRVSAAYHSLAEERLNRYWDIAYD